MGCGTSPEDAKKALKEAVHLFVETAREMGTLEDILDECGYEYKEPEWNSPSWIAIERETMAVGV
jgi:predicted RNase H-like HicB family nuclease